MTLCNMSIEAVPGPAWSRLTGHGGTSCAGGQTRRKAPSGNALAERWKSLPSDDGAI